MTDRERLLWTIKANSALEHPEVLLEALEAAGWAWYRREDALPVAPMKAAYNLAYGQCADSAATHRLVPVGGDS
jgi:hypothetical protein